MVALLIKFVDKFCQKISTKFLTNDIIKTTAEISASPRIIKCSMNQRFISPFNKFSITRALAKGEDERSSSTY